MTKYWPVASGETLNVADPVTLAADWFTALKNASCLPPIGTVTAVFSGLNIQGRPPPILESKRTEIVLPGTGAGGAVPGKTIRSEEHTSELQSLLRISYAVFCFNKKKTVKTYNTKT